MCFLPIPNLQPAAEGLFFPSFLLPAEQAQDRQTSQAQTEHLPGACAFQALAHVVAADRSS